MEIKLQKILKFVKVSSFYIKSRELFYFSTLFNIGHQ